MKKPLKEYFLFTEAWILLAVSRIILIFLPFKKVVPLLGTKTSVPKRPTIDNKQTLESISIAIARACRFSFWRTMCFEQAITAKLMLKSRHIRNTIYFGVQIINNGTKTMSAHAWVESNGIIVTGAKGIEKFTVITSFSS